MRDEFRGDFTRDTTNTSKQFSRVLITQGKVLLDSDFNELQDILVNYLRTLTMDLIGDHGGPGNGFKIDNLYKRYDKCCQPDSEDGHNHPIARDMAIFPGRYYIDGILCENPGTPRKKGDPAPLSYKKQDGYPFPYSLDLDSQNIQSGDYIVYLDIWERTISYLEDDDIREKALAGVDTAVRSKIVWQVKTWPLGSDSEYNDKPQSWHELTRGWKNSRGRLKARIKSGEGDESANACLISPDARFRGFENCLYRVEVHRPGKKEYATFKWSCMNGSVDFGALKITQSVNDDVSTGKKNDVALVELKDLGRDNRLSLSVGDWVEVLDDDRVLRSQAFPLWQVDSVSRDRAQVTLKRTHSNLDSIGSGSKNAILRRWDHKESISQGNGGTVLFEGAAIIREGEWLDMDNGIQIWFQDDGDYHTGDYWLIPARVETGSIEWPQRAGAPDAIQPHGIEHHYAPLSLISVDSNGNVSIKRDCRCTFGPIAVCHAQELKKG